MKTLIIYLLILHSSHHISTSITTNNLIHLTCKKSSTSNPNIPYSFCIAALQSAPTTHCAALPRLGLLSLCLLNNNITDTLCRINLLLKANRSSVTTLGDYCDLYFDTVNTLKEPVGDHMQGNYFESDPTNHALLLNNNINNTRCHVKLLLKANQSLTPAARQALKGCRDLYSNVVDTLKEVIGDSKKDPTNHVRLLNNNITDTRCRINLLLKTNQSLIVAALEDCRDLYSDVVDTLKEAIGDYKEGNYFDANIKVSAVMDGAVTCEDGFRDGGVPSPLTTWNGFSFRLSSISLYIINLLQAPLT